MTEAQLKTALKAAYDGVSDNPNIDPATARQTMADAIGAAIDTFVSTNVANPNNLTTVRYQLIELITELKKLKVDIGNNLDLTVLTTIETALESF